ncbi:glycoside hydrolase family 2 TIM barrel-domain containing protein [Anaerobutyricum hallii]|uniref:glycoside hydrolase family 2 TIM barrel-domain containing protein n=1 Tax=Anaerobutyricum hallii TaxID=39488 RepID=UPI003AB40C24
MTENGTEEKEQNLKVNNPALWSTEKPNLYYVQTEVLVGDEVKDINKETFGFRYIDFNSNTGFSLNGKNVKLKGVCMHHDQGALGSASERDAVYRQVSKLKEMGCNAIRTAHNTPSSVLLEACNELGMMVMDETFDGWAFPKNGNSQDFSTHYNKTISEDNKLLGATAGDTWYKFVLESNIERDKNDPSVVIWDIGNELNFGVTDPSKYEQYAKNMKSYIEAIDKTRPITVGDNNPYGLRYNTYGDFRNKVTAVLANNGEGLAGANYSMAAMSGIHSAHPDWKIIATETASPSNSRGIYTTLSQYGKSGDYQCTAYDTNAVSWGNTARESWWYTIKDDFVSGEFIWTGFDYIGEPTPWNGTDKGSVSGDKLAVPNSSYFGVIDTAGFEKDSFYFYTSQWREDKQTLHIVPQSWNKKDLSISGGKVPVYVYSNAAKVELYLNGKLIGTSTRNPIKTAAGHEWATYSNESNDEEQCVAVNESQKWKAQAIQFKVKYAEGTLSAKAYDEDGKEITDTLGSQSVTTNSDAGSKLSVKAEKSKITADGSSLSYIAVDVNDKDGRFVSSADNSIRFTLTGNGTIVGVDNGNPSTVNKFQQKSVLTSSKTAKIKAFSGKALVIVRSTKDAGGFALKAESAGLTGETVFVNTVGEKNGEVFLKDYTIKPEYTVMMGTKPELETTVTGTMSDGSKQEGTIDWKLTEDVYNHPGEYVLDGTMKFGKEEVAVSANLHVKPIIVAVQNYTRATVKGLVPTLPSTLAGILPDGTSYGAYPVTWDSIKESDLENVGDVVKVKGKVDVEGKEMTATATIRVAEGEVKEAVNIAPKYKTLKESCGEPADNLLSIVDGVNNVLDRPNMRWTNWNDHLLNSSPTITFTWDEVYELASIKAWFFGDMNVKAPESVTIAVSEDGENFKEVEFTHNDYQVNQKSELVFNEVQKAKALRFTMKQVGTGYVGLTELEIWTSEKGYTSNKTAELEELKVDGTAVEGFAADKYEYTVVVDKVDQAVVDAAAKDNASVMVVPFNKDNVVKVIVTSEDGKTTNTYKVKLIAKDQIADKVLIEKVEGEIKQAESLKKDDYTNSSYAEYEKALKEVKAVIAKEIVTKDEVNAALEKLQTARGNLVKVTKPAPDTNKNPEKPSANKPETGVPSVGMLIKYKKAIYKVREVNATGGTVMLVKRNSKKAKFVIPAAIKSRNYTFKVTSIANKAFKGDKKLKKVVIGKNVQVIGKRAFEKAKNLRSITIKSVSLKKVGRSAFKGIHAKAKIKVPAKKLKAYKRLLKKKGQKSSVKIIK